MSRPSTAPAARRPFALAALLIATSLLSGCASKKPVAQGVPPLDVDGSAAFGTFVKQNEALLKPQNSKLVALHTAGDGVYAYTSDNRVYALSDGLDIRYVVSVGDGHEKVRPPVIVNNETIFPTNVGLEVFNETGAAIRSVPLKDPLTTDVRPDGKGKLIAGTAAPTGGMISIIDPSRVIMPVGQRSMIGNLRSAPVALQGMIFAANTDGGVYAIDPSGLDSRGAWGLKNMRFQTHGEVSADLVVDEYAVYVASGDTNLYALDRGTGKIKWRYPSEAPLRDAPLVTRDSVFQVVPGKGLVALSKTDEAEYHNPKWTTPGISRVLSADDKYVYAVEGKDRLVALGLNDGKTKFSVAGDFDYFTAGRDGKIFAATDGGALVSFKRGTYTGGDMATAR